MRRSLIVTWLILLGFDVDVTNAFLGLWHFSTVVLYSCWWWFIFVFALKSCFVVYLQLHQYISRPHTFVLMSEFSALLVTSFEVWILWGSGSRCRPNMLYPELKCLVLSFLILVKYCFHLKALYLIFLN